MMTNIRLTLMSDNCRWIHQVATYHRIRHLPLLLLLLRFPPTIVSPSQHDDKHSTEIDV